MNNKLHDITDDERKEIHKCLLHMLKDIISVCEKHHITYMLGGGSALGAVRHKGFIPWDDDLDINMPRHDYEKFIAVMHEELGEFYDFSYPQSNNVDYSFLKIYKKDTIFKEVFNDMSCNGIWIDIFPIEYAPNNKLVRQVKGVIADVILHGVAASLLIAQKNNSETKKVYSKNVRSKCRYYWARIIGTFMFFISYKKVVNFFDSFVKCENKSDVMTVPTGRAHYLGECLPADVIFPVRKMMFCGIETNVYHGVDKYLTKLYGDYMQIPPENKRERHYILEFYVDENIKWKTNGDEILI